MSTNQPDGKKQHAGQAAAEQQVDELVEAFLEGVPDPTDGEFDVCFKDLDVVGAGFGVSSPTTGKTSC